MKPLTPFIQAFDELPETLPIYSVDNALLPGGQLPLEFSSSGEIKLFLHALKADQLVGMVQRKKDANDGSTYQTGCAGRIRQYRERSDGRLNIMLAGICRFKIIEDMPGHDGYRIAKVDWSDFGHDYETETVDASIVDAFKLRLGDYFDKHRMQTDWNVLEGRPIEEVVNNLVLVINLDTDSKQQLLEASTLTDRVMLFTKLLEVQPVPISVPKMDNNQIN